jgi:signal transduction histidine kinase
VIGAVSLDLAKSQDLIEKTSREGFVENAAFREFQHAVSSVVANVEAERNQDKLHIRQVYTTGRVREPVLDSLDELRDQLRARGLDSELSQLLDDIERQFRDTRERLLTAAGAGLGLVVVIHEVERGVADLRRAIDRGVPSEDLRALAEHTAEVIEGLTFITRRSGRSVEAASLLVRQALFNTTFRLRAHGISVLNVFDAGHDFKIRCSRRLVVATLMNLIDNSIYWLDVKGGDRKLLYLGPSRDLPGGPAIVVGDSGPGFSDPPDVLVQAMVSRKPEGMGIGLHLADQVMTAEGGKLSFPAVGDVSLPEGISGAVVALVFTGQDK